MRATRTLRLLALLAATVLLLGSACNRGNNDDDNDTEATVEPTTEPVETPGAEAAGDFQLVGSIDEAFAGQDPPVEISTSAFDDTDNDSDSDDATASPAGSPAATPVGETPTRGGIIRLQIEDLSDDLRDECGVDAEDVVHVYWTTETAFEPGDVLDDVEDEIEDRTAGVVGSIYQVDGTDDDAGDPDIDIETASPSTTDDAAASPDATPDDTVEASDCLLVAEQIGFTNTDTLPTPRPRAAVRRTAAPGAPARTATPTPRRTATPAPETDEPTEEPTDPPATVDPSPDV